MAELSNWKMAQLQAAQKMVTEMNRRTQAMAEQLRSDGFGVTFENGAMVVRMPEDRICRHCKRAIVASAAGRDWALSIPGWHPVLFCPDSPAELQLHEPEEASDG